MIANIAGRPLVISPRAAIRAVKDEVATWGRPLRLWLFACLVLILFGVYGAIASIVPGKETFGTSPVVEWGLLIISYVFFATTTSGLCLASSLGTVFGIERFLPLERRHVILAILSLVTAFGVIALDLHYPIRLVFGAVFSPSPLSPMWWMGVFYGAYLGFLIVEVITMFMGFDRVHRYACVASSCMAVVAPSTLGGVFGVMVTRTYWHGPFTPVSFLAFALLSGISILGIVFWAVHRFRLPAWEDAGRIGIPSIRIILAIALVVVSFLTIWNTLVGLYGGMPGLDQATRAVVAGPLSIVFWPVRMVLGLLIPLIAVALPRYRTPNGLLVASVCSIVGVFADRFIFVIAGQVAPDTVMSGMASDPFAQYFPSIVEFSVLAGAVGFIGFVYTLAEQFLDLGISEGHAHQPSHPVIGPLAAALAAAYEAEAREAVAHDGAVPTRTSAAIEMAIAAARAELHDPAAHAHEPEPPAPAPEPDSAAPALAGPDTGAPGPEPATTEPAPAPEPEVVEPKPEPAEPEPAGPEDDAGGSTAAAPEPSADAEPPGVAEPAPAGPAVDAPGDESAGGEGEGE